MASVEPELTHHLFVNEESPCNTKHAMKIIQLTIVKLIGKGFALVPVEIRWLVLFALLGIVVFAHCRERLRARKEARRAAKEAARATKRG